VPPEKASARFRPYSLAPRAVASSVFDWDKAIRALVRHSAPMSVKSAGFPLPLVPARFRETAVEDPCVGRPVPREKARAFFASNATLWAATPIWMPFTPSSLKNKGVSCGESGPSLSVESPGDVRIGQHATAVWSTCQPSIAASLSMMLAFTSVMTNAGSSLHRVGSRSSGDGRLPKPVRSGSARRSYNFSPSSMLRAAVVTRKLPW